MSVLKWTAARLSRAARTVQKIVLVLGRLGRRAERRVGRKRGKEKKAMKGQM